MTKSEIVVVAVFITCIVWYFVALNAVLVAK